MHLGEGEGENGGGGGGRGGYTRGSGRTSPGAPADARCARRAGGASCTSASSCICVFLTSSPAVGVDEAGVGWWGSGSLRTGPPPPSSPSLGRAGPGLDPTRTTRLPLCSPPADNPHVYLMLTCCLC